MMLVVAHLSSRTALVLLPGLIASAGCQLVVGTGSRAPDPIVTANALPGVGDGGTPSLGNGRIRIANLAVTPGNVDFCIKPSSATSWGLPVMANSGTDAFFRGGLAYPQVTVPFSAPVGKLSVRFIPAGDVCSGRVLSEANGIDVGDSTTSPAPPVVTVLRYGGKTALAGDDGIPEAVVGLNEETISNPTCPASSCTRFRVVNAAASPNVIDFGETALGARALPATVPTFLANTPIPPGSAVASQPAAPPLTAADSSGYVGIVSGAGEDQALLLGIVSYPPGAPVNTALAVFQPSPAPDTQTLYFIGDPNNNVHPLQGLLVEDNTAATGPVDAGIDYAFLAKSALTTPATITVDTFYAGLYGLTAPYTDVRRPAVMAALSARQSDAICIVEIDYDADKSALASEAANGNFPYSYWVPTTIATPPTNPSDWYGNTPPTLSTAACGAESADTMNVIAAAAAQCSTGQDDAEDAGVSSAACMETALPSALAGLLYGSSPDPACVDCVVFYLQSGYAIDFMKSECGGDNNDPYGQFNWGGQNGTMILSKHPFAKKADGVSDDTEAFILPSSSYKRVVLRARLQLDMTNQVDVYCAQFVASGAGSGAINYVGAYGVPDAGLYEGEADADNGWRDEDSLEARDTLEWIRLQSGGRPAVVAGHWETCPGYSTSAGVPVLDSLNPEVLARLVDGGLVPAHPAGYVPSCDDCNANPYNNGAGVTTDGTIGYDYSTTFLWNFPAGSTLSDTFWNTDPSSWNVAPPGLDGGLYPLSYLYPRTVQVLAPAPSLP